MQITIAKAERVQVNMSPIAISFVLALHDKATGDNLDWPYALTPEEVAAGDIDAIIKRETLRATTEFSKFADPAVVVTDDAGYTNADIQVAAGVVTVVKK